MNVPILFYLVCVFFGLACCGVVPSNFKSTHDEHHGEEILTSSGTNASIPAIENSESPNASGSALVELHHLNISEVLVSEFHNVSDLIHVQNAVTEDEPAAKKLSKGSSRSKKKSPKDSTSIKKQSHEIIDHAGMNNTQSHGSLDDNTSGLHHLQTEHKTEHLKIHGSIDDHFSEPHHLQTDHKAEDSKPQGVVEDHSSKPNHLQTDRKSDNLEFHGTVGDHFSRLDHASEDFSHTTSVSKGLVHVENITAHFVGGLEHSNDFSTKSEAIMLKSPDHELNNKETDFITQAIDDENHTKDVKHESNNLNQEFSNISHSDDLANPAEDLISDSNSISLEKANDSIINNLSDFSNAIEDVTHDLNNISQDSLNASVGAQSNDSTKPVNEVHKNVSEDLKSALETTSEFVNDSNDSQNTTESGQEHSNHAENNVLKSTVARLTNSKLFLNIHNSFMRLNPTEKFNSAQLNHEDETAENVLSIAEDLTASKINGENSGKSSDMEAISREVDTLDIKEGITSPIITDSNIPVTESENEVKFSSGHTDTILVDPKINNKSESIDTETKVVNVVENDTSQGLFSSLGLNFLMNSELAKNAASAMEVFNFTDSALTDHIIDDQNDMHDLLDIRLSVVDDHNLSNSESSEQINSIVDTDSSTFNTDSSTLVTDTSNLSTESSILDLESSSSQEVSVTEVNNKLKNETFVKEIDFSSELSAGNGSTPTLSHTILNTTKELGTVTMVPATLLNNTTVGFEVTTDPAKTEARNASDVVGEVMCPPQGFCIFWFFAQDTCTVNSHCLGSRICCRIGCSKTCVEV